MISHYFYKTHMCLGEKAGFPMRDKNGEEELKLHPTYGVHAFMVWIKFSKSDSNSSNYSIAALGASMKIENC